MKEHKTMKERNSSLELLRIIAMLFIIVHHYSIHGNIQVDEISFSINKIILEIVRLGNLGVVIFVMITGYYMISSKYDLKKLIRIYCPTLFYSILIYCLTIVFGEEIVTPVNIIRTCLPIIFAKYWFMTAYTILFLLVPYINMVIKQLSIKQQIVLISLMFGLWSIIPTFTPSTMYSSEVIQFVMYYIIGASIRLNKEHIQKNIKYNSYAVALLSAALIVSSVILEYTKLEEGTYFYDGSSSVIILLAATIVIKFVTMKPFTNKFINTIAASTFGVYLIHDNYCVRSFLWGSVFSNDKYVESNVLILHMLIATVAVFSVCTVVEHIRRILMSKTENRLVDFIANVFERLGSKISC